MTMFTVNLASGDSDARRSSRSQQPPLSIAAALAAPLHLQEPQRVQIIVTYRIHFLTNTTRPDVHHNVEKKNSVTLQIILHNYNYEQLGHLRARPSYDP